MVPAIGGRDVSRKLTIRYDPDGNPTPVTLSRKRNAALAHK